MRIWQPNAWATPTSVPAAPTAAWAGPSGLRTLRDRDYNRVRRSLGHLGPYLPLIYEACQANQFSYEYQHGVTSYGAFTYTLSRVLRQHRASGQPITFAQLVDEAKETLANLRYDQVPTLLGPAELLTLPVP
jgi:hypothetical protein